MTHWHEHRSNPAKPGRPRCIRPGLLFRLAHRDTGGSGFWCWGCCSRCRSRPGPPAMKGGAAAPTKASSFTDFVNQVDANDVRTASVAPDGHVTGLLTSGDRDTSQVPTAIPETQLAAQLQDHQVQVNGTTGGVCSPGGDCQLVAAVVVRGVLRMDGPAGPGPSLGITGVGRSKARSRPRRPADDPLRRCGRLRRREAGSRRGGRLPEEP